MKLATLLHPGRLKSPSPRQVISADWADRNSVLEKDVNLFCWDRIITGPLDEYLRELIAVQPQPIRFFISGSDKRRQFRELRKCWDFQHSEGADLFWEDVFNLVRDFLEFSDVDSGMVHLRVVTDDSCRKFHTDAYSLRLFTTYYGPGTEWLPESNTNRSGLGKSNDQIVKHQKGIRRMQAGQVGILKGEPLGRKTACKGIVHRSPAISSSGKKRIISRVDI